ncbi:hypothetical protein [Kitasatospora sp. NPDC056531]|uniref:hypothetical protein n=1 Tax=Kitasatospora sp. NPDC056531 TaxID=3345856 RepID=UPI0036C18ADB
MGPVTTHAVALAAGVDHYRHRSRRERVGRCVGSSRKHLVAAQHGVHLYTEGLGGCPTGHVGHGDGGGRQACRAW